MVFLSSIDKINPAANITNIRMLAMLSTAVELMSSDYIKWTCVPMIIIKIIAADPIHEKRMQKIKAAGTSCVLGLNVRCSCPAWRE
ncbi:hypothetical protein GCM10008915_14000 [Bifidobacterium pullorum subsp. gallinarum]